MQLSHLPNNFSNHQWSPGIKSREVLISNRGLEHINCILPAYSNRGALYLGDIVSTLKTELLEKHKIKFILTCMTEPSNYFSSKVSRLNSNILKHTILPIRDNLEFPIAEYFITAKHLIDEARCEGHNVLVHCHAGVSRSATIVCAYLMLQNLWTVEQALQFIRERRYRAKPNTNFISQLHLFWERQLRNQRQIRNASLLIPISNSSPKVTQKVSKQKSFQKQQTTIFITLDSEVETHDELLDIEMRKKHQKQKQRNYKLQGHLNPTNDNQKKQQRKRADLLKRQKHEEKNKLLFKSSFEERDKESPYSGSRAYEISQRKRYEINFNKAFDPKLVKSNVEIKNVQIKNGDQLKQINAMQNKSWLQSYNRGCNRGQIEARKQQIYNSINGSIVLSKEFVTPIKQNKVVTTHNVVFTNPCEKPSNGILINYRQETPKNYARYSLTGQNSSYKGLY